MLWPRTCRCTSASLVLGVGRFAGYDPRSKEGQLLLPECKKVYQSFFLHFLFFSPALPASLLEPHIGRGTDALMRSTKENAPPNLATTLPTPQQTWLRSMELASAKADAKEEAEHAAAQLPAACAIAAQQELQKLLLGGIQVQTRGSGSSAMLWPKLLSYSEAQQALYLRPASKHGNASDRSRRVTRVKLSSIREVRHVDDSQLRLTCAREECAAPASNPACLRPQRSWRVAGAWCTGGSLPIPTTEPSPTQAPLAAAERRPLHQGHRAPRDDLRARRSQPGRAHTLHVAAQARLAARLPWRGASSRAQPLAAAPPAAAPPLSLRGQRRVTPRAHATPRQVLPAVRPAARLGRGRVLEQGADRLEIAEVLRDRLESAAALRAHAREGLLREGGRAPLRG